MKRKITDKIRMKLFAVILGFILANNAFKLLTSPVYVVGKRGFEPLYSDELHVSICLRYY